MITSESFGYLPLFLISIATQTTIPIPLDVIVVGMAKFGFNAFLVTAVATLGLTIGAILDYVVGRYGFSAFPWFRKEKHTKSYKRAERFYQKYGEWTLLVTFFPFIGKYFPLLAGVMDTPWLNFLSIYLLGKVLYYAAIFILLRSLIFNF